MVGRNTAAETDISYQLRLSDSFLWIRSELGVLHFLEPRLLGQPIHIQPNVPGSCIGKSREPLSNCKQGPSSSEKRPVFLEPLARRPADTSRTAALTNQRRRSPVFVPARVLTPGELGSSSPAPAPEGNWGASHTHCLDPTVSN